MTRCVLRYGVLTALALGGVTLLVGPERVAAGLAQVRNQAQGLIDGCLDDPMALRRQLEQLADDYPDRIAEVRGEIAEVNHQINQFGRDMEISNRVVAMTTEDLSELRGLVARAEAEAGTSVRRVALRFDGVRYDIDEAYSEGRRINNVRGNYQDRLAHDKVQLAFLKEQSARLTSILDKLESEYSTYQSQLWQLDREIDAIERNDRLIELTERQQATLDSYERFGKVSSLKQLEGELAKIRTIQLAQLEVLEKANIGHDYEDQARHEIDTDNFTLSDPFADAFESDDAEVETNESDSVAWMGPQVIE